MTTSTLFQADNYLELREFWPLAIHFASSLLVAETYGAGGKTHIEQVTQQETRCVSEEMYK
ncbi:MAG: hypothetical protein AAGD25_23380 [Cyanobacteria bacterium P01_F01_bin.150]